jgi:hypothetical protein
MFISSMEMKTGNTRSKRPLNFTFDRALTVCFYASGCGCEFSTRAAETKEAND